MGDLTLAQRLPRPVLNYLIETFFPSGALFGDDYFKAVDKAKLAKNWGTSEMGCATYMISSVRENGRDKAVFSVEDMTNRGEPVGSWSLTVERTDCISRNQKKTSYE